MTERLAGIEVFVTAVETGGFSAAAQRLNLSRSVVGKTVARLEARLGVRLLHRTTRRLSLTDDGAVFFERAQRALADLKAAESAIEEGRAEPAGRLRLSAPMLFGRRCVAPVLRGLARRWPRLEIEASFTDRVADLVEEGLDLVVRNGPRPATGALMSRKVAEQRMGVFAAPAYVARRGEPQVLDDLPAHDAVVYSRPGRWKAWLFPDGQGGLRQMDMRPRLSFDDLESIRDAAVEGMGLAWLPSWLAAGEVRAGSLVPVLCGVPLMAFESHVLWPKAPHLPSRVRAAIDALARDLPRMIDGLTQAEPSMSARP